MKRLKDYKSNSELQIQLVQKYDMNVSKLDKNS